MKLKDLLKNVEVIETRGDFSEDLDIKDIAYDSKKVTKNSAFVAIKGHFTDGHKYIKDAFEKGAKVAFVEDFSDVSILQLRTKSSRETLADISCNFFENPSKDLYMIGITATNGKTTTAFMTNSILRDYKIKTGLMGTVATNYENVTIPSILTTPESRELQEYLLDMKKRGITDVVMEVSSHAQEQSRVKNIDFDIVTFNNFSREHIDQHGSFEKYYEEKSKLIKNAGKNTVAILNFDEEKIKALSKITKAKVLSYSLKTDTEDFSVSDIDLSTGFAKYKFSINRDLKEFGISKGKYEIELGVAGYSGVMNSVVAIIVSLVRKIPIENIVESLRNFKGVERRFEMIYDEEFKIIDDHYANSRNINVTMQTIDMMKFKNLKMLYAIRGMRGVHVNTEAAQESAKWLKKFKVSKIYATSSKEIVTKKDEVQNEEKAAFLKIMQENNIEVEHFERLDEALYNMLSIVEKGDLMLLAGCQGMDKGGRIILEKIVEDKDEIEREKILKPVKNRIC